MPDYKTIHVTAGNFGVSTKKPLIYESYLSSCVGVALYDPANGIGGMGHFLLPEPISVNSATDLKKYAETGLPMMLEEMQRQGAVLSEVEAAIAGGAFTGDVSQQDIDLDIGGRTAGVVRRILSENRIRIVSAETGGFFSSKMRLNMMKWKVTVSLFRDRIEETRIPDHVSILEEIEKKYDKIQPIPQVALKILRMINDDTGSFEDFSAEVKKDQVISAQVLKFCNSAIFGGRGKIDTISDALMIIGQTNLARLLTTIVVKRIFSGSEKGYSMVQGGLYHHSIGVGLLSEKLAHLTKSVNPFTAYTAGLLHDIGKVVLDQFVAGYLPLFYRECSVEKERSTCGVERIYFRTDHTETGARLAALWELPGTVCDVIEYHHSPENSGENRDLVSLVALADLLYQMFKAGPNLVRVDISSLEFLLESIGMTITDFPSLVDLIPLNILTADPEAAII